jgi:hypothetical protein
MLYVPTYVIGAFLILTGLLGYLIQDPGLSLKLKGPLASDAQFILSDGVEKHEMDFIPCPESAGENVWWIAHKLNEDHAGVASQKNFATENGANDNELRSFWYASSKGETMEGFLLESQRYNNAGTGEKISLDWTKVDVNSSALRIIYKNAAGNPGPVSLTSNNWENVAIDPPLEPGDELSFSKSWTAFIPGIFGILLIVLARGAETLPNARKHIMHVAVLIGLIGFAVSTKKIGSAVAEMNWLKNEPYGIVHASMLKPLSMLLTSGLLFIFVILCINSFISARKEKAAQAKLDEEKKKKVLRKVKNKNASATDAIPPSGTKDSDEEDKRDSDEKMDEDDKKDEDEKRDSDEVVDDKENSSASKDDNEMDYEKNKDVSDSDPIDGDQEKDRSSPSNDSPSENDDKKEDNNSEVIKKEKVSTDSKDSSEEEDSESKKETKEESQDHKD